ncbi:MAG: ABC transporter ATP-binding protein [Candidatus Rokuibacteriota bacterium]
MADPDVELRDASKRYGAVQALDGVSLEVGEGEFFTLLGPSGCGKTTTLRAVAGFVALTSGDVRIRGARVNEVPPHRRRVGMVFQHYALFPHRTVFQNVAFGLRMQKAPRDETARRVRQALALVRLEGYEARYPRQLSGGEQQRVALARAIVTRPAVLLLDEPLGALDRKLREHMQIELKRLQAEVGITTIYVTHDQEEALTMSDRIAVMRAGRVEQVGTAVEIYETPRTAFVADFIGSTNLLRGRVAGRGEAGAAVDVGGGLIVHVRGEAPAPGSEAVLAVRPEKLRLDPAEGLENTVRARVTNVVYLGDAVVYHLESRAGVTLRARALTADRMRRYAVGDEVRVGWPAAATVVVAG